MSKKSHYLTWNKNDTLRSYLKHAYQDTVNMWPFAKVYGLRYYWDYDYRRKCKRSFENRMKTERYGNNWDKRRAQFINQLHIRDGWGCNACRKVEHPMTIDHIVPLFAGGPNTIDNVQLLCNACHAQKSKGENKRYPFSSKDKQNALASEAKKIKALRLEAKAVGALQGPNSKSLRKSVLYVRKDKPGRKQLADGALHTKWGLRRVPALRPTEPEAAVLPVQR